MEEPLVSETELTLLQISQCFNNAVNDVLSTMAGFEAQVLDEFLPEVNRFRAQISGAMLLLGQNSAMFTLSMSEEAAMVFVAYMTGIFPEDLSREDLYDGVAELVNQIAGRVKAQLSGSSYHFILTPPFTIAGDDHFIVHKNQVTRMNMTYGAGNLFFRVEVFYV
jgi:chemotaxis protein CheX